MGIKDSSLWAREILSFLETAKNGSINGTAEANAMKQSNLSRTLKSLEEKLKCQLLERGYNGVRLTENGHVKSTLLLNSFCLSILFLAVYGAAFFLLTDPIHAWLALAPRAVENLVSALLPALIGTAICALTHLICHPQTVLAAYGWLLLLALASLVTMLLLLRGDSGASVLFLQLFGMMVPVPLLMGFGSSWWLLRRRNSL